MTSRLVKSHASITTSYARSPPQWLFVPFHRRDFIIVIQIYHPVSQGVGVVWNHGQTNDNLLDDNQGLGPSLLMVTYRRFERNGWKCLWSLLVFRVHLNNKYAAEMKLSIPKLDVTADYDVRGSRVLTLDISGKGKLRSNFSKFYF